MTKLFLAAGVAALAITAQASAAPGDREERQNRAERTKVERPQRAERVQTQRAERQAQRVERRAQRVERPQRVERQAQRVERAAAQRIERPQRIERAQQRIDTRQARVDNRVQRIDTRQARVENRAQRIDNRMAKQQARAENRMIKQEMRAEQRLNHQVARAERQAMTQAVRAAPLYNPERIATLRAARVNELNDRYGYRFAAPTTAASLLGLPLTRANSIIPLSPVPSSIAYLYPSNSMWDYRYGDGYIYQVDKTSNLIAALIPLLIGGYMPGQYLPASYMNSYVPNYYGYNSFYPNYNDQCTRYANGVVYYVDCYTGMIENVMPLYDSGYGVGQMLPSSYGYYNVPSQYRPYYYDTGNTGYWYAPGAIYQYDRDTSLITSVAALLSPGLTIGQPLPTGYGVYNVPLGFRDTYYDTPDHWYRYSNGYIYQVDPMTQLVTAIVASALT